MEENKMKHGRNLLGSWYTAFALGMLAGMVFLAMVSCSSTHYVRIGKVDGKDTVEMNFLETGKISKNG